MLQLEQVAYPPAFGTHDAFVIESGGRPSMRMVSLVSSQADGNQHYP